MEEVQRSRASSARLRAMSVMRKAASSRNVCAASLTRVLFDEVEKAHPDVWNMLLQILEEGKLTDNIGRVVISGTRSFLMTSNVGSDTIKRGSSLGFLAHHGRTATRRLREKILDESKRVFRPEFLNRLDDIIVFRSLLKPELIEILSIEIGKVMERLKSKNLTLETGTRRPRTSWWRRARSAIRRAPDAPLRGAVPGRPAGRGNPQGPHPRRRAHPGDKRKRQAGFPARKSGHATAEGALSS